MTTKDLISALQKLDPDANVVINIKQSNKVYGYQVNILDTKHGDSFSWVTTEYGGSITVFLPDGAYISKFEKFPHK